MRPGSNRLEDNEGDLAFLILEISVVILLFLFMLSFSGGSQRRVLGLIIIGLTAIMVSARLLEKTSLLPSWRRENKLDNVVSLQLPRADRQVKGASKGKDVSQAFFEERLREIFLEKVREEHGLSEERIEEIAEDPQELYEIVQDKKLVKFIMESKDFRQVVREKDYEESESRILSLFRPGSENISSDDDYKKKMKDIINRMEEWPWK